VDFKVLSKEMLNQIIHIQISDTFSELFQWKEGSYSFHPKSVDFNEKIYTPLALEHILLDVLRMIDEWPNVRKSIRSIDMIFEKTDRFLNGEEDSILQEEMSKEEAEIYNLVDGQSNVQDIVDKSLLGKFTASKYLMSLMSAGYIEVVIKEERVTADNKIRKYIAGKHVMIAGGYAILAMLIIVITYLSPPDIKSTCSMFLNNLDSHVTARTFLEHNRLLKVKNALQIYFWEKGEYPGDIKELVDNGILHGGEIKNSMGEKYFYSSKGDSYSLH
jgi:hypothetical protein